MRNGFTLIEIVVVLGITTMLASVLLFADMTTYKSSSLREERERLVTLLERARAQAMTNVHQSPHGVRITAGGYVQFEGDSFATAHHDRDVTMQTVYPVVFANSSPNEIVFSQLSGDANYEGDIVLSDPNSRATAVFSINHEGAISW